MPAKSKKQRRWSGARLAEAKAGHNTTGMSMEELEKYASTSEKGLPMRKGKKGNKQSGKKSSRGLTSRDKF